MEPVRKGRILAITSLAHFANDGTFLIFPLLIVYYHSIFNVSLVFLGILSIIYTLLSGLLSPFIGDFADKHDLDAKLMSLGIFLEAISFMLFGISFISKDLVYFLTVLASIILGIGQAFYHPIGGAMISRSFKEQAGRALGINGSMGSIGRSVMPSIVTLFIVILGEVTGLITLSVYMIAVTLIIFFGLSFYKKDVKEGIRSKKEKLDRVFYKFLIILGIIVFIRSMFITGTTTFTGQFIYDVYLSKTLSGIFLTIGFIGSVFGQPAFGYLTEKKGGRFTFALTSVLSILFFLGFLIFSKNLILASLLYTLFTFAAYSSFPVLLGYVSQTFPKNFYTVANSYVWGIGVTVGGAAGNAMITALLGIKLGILTSFYIMLGLSIISAVLIPLIPKGKIGK
ncbi:MFS transporter [Acidianus sulfidivorans JP7]|uniref:MFS transporter n=1 Tax=Acidianus sulfidivorans JP7 TaxID=619593 RepID=A0A2U9IPI1_9CREN|nr:MFS transporter [Acidianus sulfidivorans]AWR97886.1 MFS transporter [Acidianus sulfidivorans JP7]